MRSKGPEGRPQGAVQGIAPCGYRPGAGVQVVSLEAESQLSMVRL